MKYKNEYGITLIALVITVIVLLILAGIGISQGGNIIKKAKLESLKTNMLLIQAKAKEYVEEVNFKKGPKPNNENINNIRNEIYIQKGGLISAFDASAPDEVYNLANRMSNGSLQFYYMPRATLDNIGLSKVEDGEKGGYYVVGFDEQNINVEIYNTIGFKNNGQTAYSLTELEEIKEVK